MLHMKMRSCSCCVHGFVHDLCMATIACLFVASHMWRCPSAQVASVVVPAGIACSVWWALLACAGVNVACVPAESLQGVCCGCVLQRAKSFYYYCVCTRVNVCVSMLHVRLCPHVLCTHQPSVVLLRWGYCFGMLCPACPSLGPLGSAQCDRSVVTLISTLLCHLCASHLFDLCL